jgi:hypothetical protein
MNAPRNVKVSIICIKVADILKSSSIILTTIFCLTIIIALLHTRGPTKKLRESRKRCCVVSKKEFRVQGGPELFLVSHSGLAG